MECIIKINDSRTAQYLQGFTDSFGVLNSMLRDGVPLPIHSHRQPSTGLMENYLDYAWRVFHICKYKGTIALKFRENMRVKVSWKT